MRAVVAWGTPPKGGGSGAITGITHQRTRRSWSRARPSPAWPRPSTSRGYRPSLSVHPTSPLPACSLAAAPHAPASPALLAPIVTSISPAVVTVQSHRTRARRPRVSSAPAGKGETLEWRRVSGLKGVDNAGTFAVGLEELLLHHRVRPIVDRIHLILYPPPSHHRTKQKETTVARSRSVQIPQSSLHRRTLRERSLPPWRSACGERPSKSSEATTADRPRAPSTLRAPFPASPALLQKSGCCRQR